MWAMLAFCMANCATVGPLMKYYKGPAVYRTLFSLGYDFVISFQVSVVQSYNTTR